MFATDIKKKYSECYTKRCGEMFASSNFCFEYITYMLPFQRIIHAPPYQIRNLCAQNPLPCAVPTLQNL